MQRYLKKMGENIRTARKKQNISQEALADMANIDRSHMGFIERGRKDIRISTLVKIAEALKLTPKDLMPQ